MGLKPLGWQEENQCIALEIEGCKKGRQ